MIAEKPAGLVAHDDIRLLAGARPGLLVEHLVIAEEARAGAGDADSLAGDLRTGAVVQDEIGLALGVPRRRGRKDQVTDGVARREPQSQEQPGRQAGRPAGIGLRLVLVGEHGVEDMRAEAGLGAHVFNTVLTYKDEPQSYAGRPPGLSTRLFLRLGLAPSDTICHLIFPASTPWHAKSQTDLILHDRAGAEIARERIGIACSGSRFFRYHEVFDEKTRARAGEQPYVVVRDQTCRLFGYHGLLRRDGAFSLDHMFGF